MDEITKEIRKNPKCNINIGNETTPGCFLWMDDVVLMHTDPRMIQNMLDTTYRIAQRYRIKFGTEKSKVLHIGPPTPLRNKFTLGPQMLEATDTYKYLQGLRFPLAEASETQLGRVKAICDLARLASGIIVVISVFNSLLNNVFLFVYGMARAHGVLVCVRYYTHTLSDT